jgi:hypothetical protein
MKRLTPFLYLCLMAFAAVVPALCGGVSRLCAEGNLQ